MIFQVTVFKTETSYVTIYVDAPDADSAKFNAERLVVTESKILRRNPSFERCFEWRDHGCSVESAAAPFGPEDQ